MAKFKVGDVVVGNSAADDEYNVTRTGWKGKVLQIRKDNDEDILVENITGYTKCTCWVDSCYFDLDGNISLYADGDKIKRVIFNDPATIVLWDDGTKTIVKCQKGDVFDKEKGLALCIAKKALGNRSNYNNTLKLWIV